MDLGRYAMGFLLSDNIDKSMQQKCSLRWTKADSKKVCALVHPRQKACCINSFFLIGHAYNPVRMIANENDILADLAQAESKDDFFRRVSELTGLFVIGKIDEDKLTIVGDAAGMQCVFYGFHNGRLYVSSHTRLLEDVCGVERDPYIDRLVNYRFYPLFGKQLPGDLTPYKDFKRLIPNHYAELYFEGTIHVERFFPTSDYAEYTLEQAKAAEKRIAELMHNNMELITQKWQRPAISLTGGCDSKTTLACANGLYDRFSYFSYISSDAEKVDAKAAHQICESLGLPHTIYEIPAEDSKFPDIEEVRKTLEINSGCIGRSNANDVRKRAFFAQRNDFDIEVKSWVSECGRAYYNKRFLKKIFPASPTPRYLSSLYKVFLTDRKLAKETDSVFQKYIERYLSKGLHSYPWQELFFWEFRMSAWNGLVITGEHKYSFDITIPYNNRVIIDMLLRMPLEYRLNDTAYGDIRKVMNPKIDETGIAVTNLKHTTNRAKLERLYLEVMTRLPF